MSHPPSPPLQPMHGLFPPSLARGALTFSQAARATALPTLAPGTPGICLYLLRGSSSGSGSGSSPSFHGRLRSRLLRITNSNVHHRGRSPLAPCPQSIFTSSGPGPGRYHNVPPALTLLIPVKSDPGPEPTRLIDISHGSPISTLDSTWFDPNQHNRPSSTTSPAQVNYIAPLASLVGF
ncbi:hypothetical protein BKA56DRAFT_617363 [Ilyonectria sp. MPI-CAGE-AT-0026]|nr:hypothetical protein BKA56DRAFT_617363 [Ilyonectria sp. MPI-CAGE-AT-0026]